MLDIAPYGSWASPIKAEICAKSSASYMGVDLSEDGVYFAETRPEEKGRIALVKKKQGHQKDLLSKNFSVRTRVHEYGGVSFSIEDGKIFFSNDKDQNIYLLEESKTQDPQAITNTQNARYAELTFDKQREVLFAVCEDHQKEGVYNYVIKIDLETKKIDKVLEGHDFYSNLRISPDGNFLSVLTWDHPNMPWDETKLWVYSISDKGTLENEKLVAGSKNESIFQPEWSPDQVLHFTSDKTGYWNLYRYKNKIVEPLCSMEAEFGKPGWIFGYSTYGFLKDQKAILCTFLQDGLEKIAILSENGKLQTLDTDFTHFEFLKVRANKAIFVGSSATSEKKIVLYDAQKQEFEILKQSDTKLFNQDLYSQPQFIEFPTENNQTAFAFYYPPNNPKYKAPDKELPPLIMQCHGGPTSFSPAVLTLKVQYWTSRGFAFVDVNYGGSTGFGREYRDRLKGRWGVVDVNDCAACAKYLSQKGLADPKRMAIQGGSAGGFTTLAALAFTNTFQAGSSRYGVSDLELLTKETHKFEAHYLDQLIGSYPEQKNLYMKRSPIHSVNQISSPLLLLQGEEDRIVPKNQAELIFSALKQKGIPVSYLLFEKEGHGFRRAENMIKALQAELYFYSKVFHFPLNDPIDPIKIENLTN